MSIITVQCGNYANYVGAHFWNIQESEFEYAVEGRKPTGSMSTVNHDILYREGITLDKQVTYTPRLVAVDLKGSLGTLPELGDLYHKPAIPKLSTLNWYGEAQVMKEEPPRKNEFLKEIAGEQNNDVDKDEDEVELITDQSGASKPRCSRLYNLDDQVYYWSDYLYARFHPKSVLVVESYQHENTTHPFDTFGLGEQLWSEQHQEVGDQMDDRIRFFAEESDTLQGFHVISDSHSGFGGLTGKLVDLLADEYSSKSVLNIPVCPPTLPEYNFNTCTSRLANNALSIARFMDAGLTTPLSLACDWFPLKGRSRTLEQIEYNPNLLYHSSAVLAGLLDTISLVYRQKQNSARLCDVTSGLAQATRNFAAVETAFPVDIAGSKSVEDGLFTKLTPILPSAETTDDSNISNYPALVTLRGIYLNSIFDKRSAAYNGCGSAAEYVEYCYRLHCSRSNPRLFSSIKPLPTTKPFPHIFKPAVSVDGNILGTNRSSKTGVSIVPLLTSWSTGPAARSSLVSLGVRASKLSLGRMTRMAETGTEAEDWEQAVETIQAAAEAYTVVDE